MIPLLERLGYFPRFCVWELTLACDLRCKHCGSFAGARRREELSWEECLRVAGELADLGCEKVTLGGGEPTLHPRWDELGRVLTDRGVRVNIISNGWSWTDEHTRRAKAAGLTNAAFSLDGFEEAHDYIRRAGSFKRVVAAIESCHRAGLPVSVVTHINRLNQHTLPEFRALLGRLGISSWQPQLGSPSGTMSEHDELVVPASDLLWLVPLIAEMRTDGPGSEAYRDESQAPPQRPAGPLPAVFAADNVGYFGKCEKTLRDRGATISFWIGCRAGCQVIGIESDGTIKGCLSLPSSRHSNDLFTEGNIREASLAEIWKAKGAFAYNRQFSEDQLAGFCAVCRYRDICRGGCTWTAYSHTKNRFDNPYCFYRQAVLAGRDDLLGDEQPTDAERAYAAAHPEEASPKAE